MSKANQFKRVAGGAGVGVLLLASPVWWLLSNGKTFFAVAVALGGAAIAAAW